MRSMSATTSDSGVMESVLAKLKGLKLLGKLMSAGKPTQRE